jgi:hypothetical protein
MVNRQAAISIALAASSSREPPHPRQKLLAVVVYLMELKDDNRRRPPEPKSIHLVFRRALEPTQDKRPRARSFIGIFENR